MMLITTTSAMNTNEDIVCPDIKLYH